jgi:hypothetical protein
MRKIRAAALLLLVLGAGVGYALYQFYTGDQFLRQTILAKLAAHYHQFDVSLGRARLDLPNGRLYVDRLAIANDGAGADGGLMTAPEIAIRVDRQSIRRGEFKARQIMVNRPVLRAERMPDGRWDVADLLPLPRWSDVPPEVLIRHGTIELTDRQRPVASTLVLREVNLHLTPETDRQFRFSGSFGGEHWRQSSFEGRFDLDRHEGFVTGLVEQLAVGSALLDALPVPLAERAEPLRGLAALVEARYRVAGHGADQPIEYEVEAALESGRLAIPGWPLALQTLTAGSLVYRDGRVQGDLSGRDGIFSDSRLPFGLYDVAASIAVDDNRIEARLTGRNGVTEVQADAAFQADDLARPTRVSGEVTRLPLDDRVYTKLPPGLQATWDRFSPQGEVNVAFQVTREHDVWQRQAVVTSLGGSFQFDSFPYRLTGVTGTIRDQQDRVDVDLVAQAGNRPVLLRARVEHPGADGRVTVEVTGEQIPIDRKLLAALPEPIRREIGRMNPRGSFDVHANFWRDAGPDETLQRSVELTLKNCSMRHDAFAYPLAGITGTVSDRDGRWTFRDLRGHNDTAEVTANGTLEPPERGGEFNLWLRGREVPFERELHRALPPRWASVWEECEPQGAADFTARLRHEPGKVFRIDGVQIQLDGAALRPRVFPYRWHDVKATLVVGDGAVEIRDLSAAHERVRIRSNGQVVAATSGGYVIRLDGVDVENLLLGPVLLDAMPGRLAELIRRFELEGPIDLRNTVFEFQWSGRRGDPIRARWNAGVQFSDNRFRFGQQFEHVNGDVVLEGAFDGTQSRGQGVIDIASLSLMGTQLTSVTGPIEWVGADVTLGSDLWGKRPDPSSTRAQNHLHARLLGGAITADAVVRGEPASLRLKASLRGARLEQYAREYMPERQRLQGELSGHLLITGRAEGSLRPQGHGEVRVEKGDLYELPLVLALLKIPSLQFPDNTAFTEATAKFKLTPDEIDIAEIKLRGDAVTLTGKGSASYDRKLDLTFYTMVGRDNFHIPLITDLFRDASEQLLAIHVTGDFKNPRATPEIVPQVTDAILQSLGIRRPR